MKGVVFRDIAKLPRGFPDTLFYVLKSFLKAGKHPANLWKPFFIFWKWFFKHWKMFPRFVETKETDFQSRPSFGNDFLKMGNHFPNKGNVFPCFGNHLLTFGNAFRPQKMPAHLWKMIFQTKETSAERIFQEIYELGRRVCSQNKLALDKLFLNLSTEL